MGFNPQSLYKAPLTSCPLCDSSDIALLYHISAYELPFKTDQCRDCGFIFMNPRLKDHIITGLYSEDYFSGNADYSYHDEREQLRFSRYVWDKRIRVLRKYIKEGNFLDIGASFGGLMESAKAFYTPYGIELSEYAGNHAKKQHRDRVHIGTLEDHPFKHDFFSCISMIELIEHLEDPRSAVEECFRLLKEKGILLVQTANMAGKQARSLKENYAYYMPGHLSYFTAKNLGELLLRTGFKRVKTFYPVEFGLLPKLKKSRGQFSSLKDYKSWMRIAWYHNLSKIHLGEFAATSSMVMYAFK
ncbi:MAG: class I SAM-dependent methyltransferase [bacterium]|nr:class I SAM-dependent methyltransferase [bacterium]